MPPSSFASGAQAVIVSVIVPVYEVSREALVRCLSSICLQSHACLDIIVVDDGSPLPIAEWAESTVARDTRVRLIRQDNAGVSAARNAGLAVATGDFICFVDADDYILPDFVASALVIALEEDADAVFGGLEVRHSQGSTLWRCGTGVVVEALPTLEAIRADALSSSPTIFEKTELACITNVHSALFARRLVDGRTFRVGVSHAEDRLFIVDVLGCAQRIALRGTPWYVYDCTTSSSVTRGLSSESVDKLRQTLVAFAEVGGFSTGSGITTSDVVQRAAAQGILNYVKLIAGLLGTLVPRPNKITKMRSVLAERGVGSALSLARGARPHERVFALCARHQYAAGMLILGRIWTLVGDGRKVVGNDG